MSQPDKISPGSVYLDYAATSPLLPCVRARLHELIDLDYGNASALHSPGQFAKGIIEEARAEVARLINADPEEIIFTSGGSESNNTVTNIFSGQKIAVSSIEHPSVLESAKAHTDELTLIPVDRDGRVDPADIPSGADLVSVMLANNELGTLEPIRNIVKRCKNPSIREEWKSSFHSRGCAGLSWQSQENYNSSKTSKTYVHTDATQALGKIHIDVKDLDVDYLTISAHKIGGPIGIGALYIKKGSPFRPLIIGGHQENKRRAGTSNTLLIAGFGAAAKYVREQEAYRTYAEKIKPLRDQLRSRIFAEIPYSSANTPEQGCLPNILNMSFRAAEGESIQLYLDAAGITISTGSACASGDLAPSHVLMAIRNDAEVAHSSIRFSLGLDTTEQDVNKVMEVLPKIITYLQNISTINLGESHDK